MRLTAESAVRGSRARLSGEGVSGQPQPGQTVKVAANQAWFEYVPPRVSPPSGSLAEFGTVAVKNVKIDTWDGNGLGLERARALSNPELAPHLEFVDLGGHGYAKGRLTGDTMRTEFVCIPRPISRSPSPDGGPIRYRVAHVARLWKPGERPRLEQQVVKGDVGLSI